MKNQIPEVTDPQGAHWDQPSTQDILIDDHHAAMSGDTFNELAEYSMTQPSGVYPGKMWKQCQFGVWHLRWFGECEDPKMCSNNSRIILFCD